MPDPSLLSGITVLDFTRVLAGPYCTRLMADLGARVIKIERPPDGDETRHGYAQLDPARDDQATYFIRVNAGKLSVAVDLSHPEARGLVRDLARVADVVVENFLPGVVGKLGCDHATLAAVKPDLVYCSISGFGQTGPLRGSPAFAHIIAAVSGLLHLERQGRPSPTPAYLQAADVLAGSHAFGAIVAALFRRARTGEGAYLDVSMLEALISAEDVSFGGVLNGAEEYSGPRAGMVVHPIGERYVALQTVGAPELWPRLVGVLGRPDLTTDARFATRMARREHWPELREVIGEWLSTFASVDDAVAVLSAARIPCTAVLSPAEIAAHPHLAERGAFPAIPHPTRGTVRVTGSPFHLNGQPVGPRAGAPHRVGEHTRTVLGDVLGYPAARIDDLVKAGAVRVV